MNKNIIKVAFVVAIIALSGINLFKVKKPVPLSDIGQENVEALANGEIVGNGQPCISGKYNRTAPEVTMCGDPCVIQRCLGNPWICGEPVIPVISVSVKK